MHERLVNYADLLLAQILLGYMVIFGGNWGGLSSRTSLDWVVLSPEH